MMYMILIHWKLQLPAKARQMLPTLQAGFMALFLLAALPRPLPSKRKTPSLMTDFGPQLFVLLSFQCRWMCVCVGDGVRDPSLQLRAC